MSKDQAAAPDDIKTNLEFKKQEEFFEATYQYFREYQDKYADFYTDPKAGVPAFKAIVKLISASKAQISKVTDLDVLEEKKKEILKSINSGQNTEARKKLDELSTIVFDAFERIGISPKIHVEQDQLANFWKEEEHAGMKEMKKAFFDSFMLPEE